MTSSIASEKKLQMIENRKQVLEIMEEWLAFASHLPAGERYDAYVTGAKEMGKIARSYKEEIDRL